MIVAFNIIILPVADADINVIKDQVLNLLWNLRNFLPSKKGKFDDDDTRYDIMSTSIFDVNWYNHL